MEDTKKQNPIPPEKRKKDSIVWMKIWIPILVALITIVTVKFFSGGRPWGWGAAAILAALNVGSQVMTFLKAKKELKITSKEKYYPEDQIGKTHSGRG